MPAPLVLLTILALAYGLGRLVLAAFATARAAGRVDDALERGFASLSLGLLVCGWLALALTEIGRFSIELLAASLASAAAFGGLYVSFSRFALSRPKPPPHRWPTALAPLVVAMAFLFFRPHEYIAGGTDAGVYVNLGASIARTGGILIQDEVLAGLDPALYPALLRALPPGDAAPYYLLPGFYVPGSPPGRIVPQFYPLHPAWLAVGYGLGGLAGELLLTPLWAGLSCLAVFCLARRLWGAGVGLIALAALSVTALQVWFARYPTSEMLTQYLFWTGGWALANWLDRRAPGGLWPALAGLALGEVLLTRIDMYVLLAVPLAAGLWLALGRRWRQTDAWFFGCFGLLALHSLAHGLAFTWPYFVNQANLVWALLARSRAWLATGLALALLVAPGLALKIVMSRRVPRADTFPDRYAPETFEVSETSKVSGEASGGESRRVRMAAAAFVVGLAFYGYFLRPQVEAGTSAAYWYGGGQLPMLDQENLVRLGWYLGPPGLALALAGICLLIIKASFRRTAFLLAGGLFFGLFYLWRIQANPHQVYAMRRYVPVVLPFCTLAAAYFLAELWGTFHVGGDRRRGGSPWPLAPWAATEARPYTATRRWLSIGLAALWFSSILWSARGFVSQVDYQGLAGQLGQFNATLSPHAVLIFNDPAPVGLGDLLGTPLQFVYGHHAFTLRDPQALPPGGLDAAIHAWQAAGQPVYWMSVPGGYAWPGAAYQPREVAAFDFISRALEGRYDRKPETLIDFRWSITVSVVDRASNAEVEEAANRS